MAEKKIYIIAILALIFLTLGSVSNPRATLYEWQSFTSLKNPQDMLLYNGDVWTATTGGLIRVDPANDSYHVYTNVDGLQTNKLYCLHVDDSNRLWVGGEGRLVNFTDPAHPDGYIFTDRDGGYIDIYDIASAPGGDTLWLASAAGLSVFLPGTGLGNGLILDTYNRFGDIDRDTPARRVALDEGHVWVGSDGGLAVGSRSDIRQLKAPTGWQDYLPSDLAGLPNDSIKGLIILNDTIFVGTTTGAYIFDETIPELTSLGLYGSPLVYNMSSNNQSVYIHTSRGTTELAGGLLIYPPTAGMPIPNTTCGIVDDNGRFWTGNLIDGLYYDNAGQMVPFNTGGLPSPECRQIVSAQGKLWGAFWSNGLAYQENGVWTKVDEISDWVASIGVGPIGELWVGTWGGGVYRMLGDSIAHFNSTNSSLSGLSEAPTFVVVADVRGSGDAVWFANLRGRNGELVAVNPYDLTQWKSYVLTGGSSAEWVETIAIGQGTVYIGSQNNGIFARLYNGTPINGNDDYTWRFTTSNSNIGSDIIINMQIDRYDSLWVGTSFGLSFQALGEVLFANESLPEGFGPEVTAICFDGRGSLYAGSASGLVIRDIATGAYEFLNTENSDLVDDAIKDMYFDQEQQAIYISTASGISRLTAPAVSNTDIDNVLAYPNPYIIRFGDEVVRFALADIAEIRIFTAAGELVREIPVNGEWDGRNAAGENAASGLYLFTITSIEGDVGRGKILLIRE